MSLDQIHNMEMVLEWVKACPFPYHVSSYQGGKIAVRVTVPDQPPRCESHSAIAGCLDPAAHCCLRTHRLMQDPSTLMRCLRFKRC